jgi:hypothetical protein
MGGHEGVTWVCHVVGHEGVRVSRGCARATRVCHAGVRVSRVENRAQPPAPGVERACVTRVTIRGAA